MSADEFSARGLQLLEEQGSLAPSEDQVWGRDQQMALEAALSLKHLLPPDFHIQPPATTRSLHTPHQQFRT